MPVSDAKLTAQLCYAFDLDYLASITVLRVRLGLTFEPIDPPPSLPLPMEGRILRGEELDVWYFDKAAFAAQACYTSAPAIVSGHPMFGHNAKIVSWVREMRRTKRDRSPFWKHPARERNRRGSEFRIRMI